MQIHKKSSKENLEKTQKEKINEGGLNYWMIGGAVFIVTVIGALISYKLCCKKSKKE